MACEHDDENLLLDDKLDSCEKCITPKIKITNGRSNGIVDEDSVFGLEDSPLLINDPYRELEFHCHDVLTTHKDSQSWKKLVSVAVFCFVFMISEVIGGYLAGSSAVMADAAHLFSDFVGFLISLFSIWLGQKKANNKHTFGYHRAEVLGAFFSILIIWVLAGIFLFIATNRLKNDNYDINADTMMIMATLGLIVNLIMGGILHTMCNIHSHSHGGAKPHSSENINVKAATAHIIGDLVQSIGVLIASFIIKFYPEAKIADPICTIVFVVIAIASTITVAYESICCLLEASPINTLDLSISLQSIRGVCHVHNLHIWALSPGKNAVAVHLAVDMDCDRDTVLNKATNLIKNKINVVTCTIQLEVYNSDLISSCGHCQDKVP